VIDTSGSSSASSGSGSSSSSSIVARGGGTPKRIQSFRTQGNTDTTGDTAMREAAVATGQQSQQQLFKPTINPFPTIASTSLLPPVAVTVVAGAGGLVGEQVATTTPTTTAAAAALTSVKKSSAGVGMHISPTKTPQPVPAHAGNMQPSSLSKSMRSEGVVGAAAGTGTAKKLGKGFNWVGLCVGMWFARARGGAGSFF
jgi:hypothetical protein